MDDTNLPVDTQQDLTVQDVKKAVPTKLKSAVTQEFVNKINQSINDPLMAQSIKENFLTYTHILLDGRYQLYEYLNAVKYVSFKLMGMTNQDVSPVRPMIGPACPGRPFSIAQFLSPYSFPTRMLRKTLLLSIRVSFLTSLNDFGTNQENSLILFHTSHIIPYICPNCSKKRL